MHFLPNNYLVSGSEDCLVKLWDIAALDRIEENKRESSEFENDETMCKDNINVYTFRGHKAPVLSVTSTPQYLAN